MNTQNARSIRPAAAILLVILLAIGSIRGRSSVGAWSHRGTLHDEVTPLALQSPTSESVCTPIQLGDVVLNVPSVEIRPIFRLNGFSFPGSEPGVAVLTLWASHNRELFNAPQLLIGQTDQSPEPFRVI